MIRRGIARKLLTAAVALAFVFVVIPTQSAGARQSTTEAYVRGAHFSPDTAAVDVYLSAFSGGTSTLWLSSVSYGDVSPYRPIAPGVYAVSMRPHGAAASTAPALTWTVNISPGAAYTAAAIGTNGQLRGIVLPDNLRTPASHAGLVRVIQASSQAGHISVRATDGPVLTSDIAYGAASNYMSVPSGTWTVTAQSQSTSSLTDQLRVSVADETLTTIVVLDVAGGGLTMRTVLDASGAGTIPTGSVSAGGGGTAAHPGLGTYTLLSWTAFGCAVALATVGVLGRRRHRESRR